MPSGRRAAATAGLVLAALLAAGCAAMPDSGPVRSAPLQAGQAADYPQPIPIAPKAAMKSAEIVASFLQASQSGFTNDHAIARQYLDGALARKWRPVRGVTVISSPRPRVAQVPQRLVGSGASTQQFVARQEGELSPTGQYQVDTAHPKVYLTAHESSGGQWRISALPLTGRLLLTQSEFDQVYQPHDLYFARPGSRVLIPDPVFLPLAAPVSQQVSEMVQALSTSPAGWLSGSTVTSFPPGSAPQATVSGSVVTVHLRGAAAGRTSLAVRKSIAAQLLFSLARPSYQAPAVAGSVQLTINGVLQRPYDGSVSSAAASPAWLAPWMPAAPPRGLYFLRAGAAQEQASTGPQKPVPGPAGSGTLHLTGLAAGPRSGELAGLAAGRSVSGHAACLVYPALGIRSTQPPRRLPGRCASVSYDGASALLVVAGGALWEVSTAGGNPVPGNVLGLGAADRILDLEVAPDGVRAAMIVQDANGPPKVQIGALSYGPGNPAINKTTSLAASSVTAPVQVASNVTDPVQVAWYGNDDVLVLPHGGSELFEAPVDGFAAVTINPRAGTTSIASNGTSVAVGAGGGVLDSPHPNGLWNGVATGGVPALPGG